MYINDEFEISDEEIEKKITDKTKIVGITHVSNVLGTINKCEKNNRIMLIKKGQLL